jgi:hypothetical protein
MPVNLLATESKKKKANFAAGGKVSGEHIVAPRVCAIRSQS